jgi:hypothetical protein
LKTGIFGVFWSLSGKNPCAGWCKVNISRVRGWCGSVKLKYVLGAADWTQVCTVRAFLQKKFPASCKHPQEKKIIRREASYNTLVQNHNTLVQNRPGKVIGLSIVVEGTAEARPPYLRGQAVEIICYFRPGLQPS